MKSVGMLKLNNIKIQNTLASLAILRKEDSISRVELAAKLNCDGTTITRIIRNLAEKGLVISSGLADSTGGRPREIIRLNADAANAIGIGLDPNFITGVIVNLKGKIIIREQIFFSEKKSRDEFINGLKLITDRLIKSCGDKKPLGIGVAAFGTFSGEDKILETTVNFPAISGINLPEFFETNYSIPPEIADVTIARVLNETWFNDIGNKGSFELFVAGAGIGCATAIDGKIVFSKYSHAGEFGHSVYKIDGDKCNCGRRGCLETLCSINAIEKKARFITGNRKLRFTEIRKSYMEKDKVITEIVNESARWLGIGIANQVNSMPPDAIMISGELLTLGDEFYSIVEDTIKEYVFPVFKNNLQIIKSNTREESPAMGAASLILRKLFEEPDFLESTFS